MTQIKPGSHGETVPQVEIEVTPFDISKLAKHRVELNSLKETVKELKSTIGDSVNGQILKTITALETKSKDLIKSLETDFRAHMTAAYDKDGTRKFDGGEIKMDGIEKTFDHEKAFNWCIETKNWPMLQLNVEEFVDKALKLAGEKVDVKETQKIKASISSNLSEFTIKEDPDTTVEETDAEGIE